MFSRRILVHVKIVLVRNVSRRTPISSDSIPPIQGFRKDQMNYLEKTLGLTTFETLQVLMKNSSFQCHSVERLDEAHKMLCKMGFTQSQIKNDPTVLRLLPSTIEQHTLVLQEAGFDNIDTTCLRSFLSIGKRHIRLLKAYRFLPSETNVHKNLLSYLENDFRITQTIELTDLDTLNHIRHTVLHEYLKWYIDLNDDEVQYLFKTYPRIKNKSLRCITRSLRQLKEMGFTKKKIQRNGFLICSHPENNDRILNEVKEIAGQDVREVVLKYPKILMNSSETIKKISRCLKEMDIPDSAALRCLSVYTLSSESVYERLKYLKTVPEFHALWAHPRVLRLVHYHKKAISRLQYLQELNIKCASLHILSSTREQFEKYTREGLDRTKGKDIAAFLKGAFGISLAEIREILNKHEFWCQIPVTTVYSTFDMLKEKSYLNKHLYHNMHILLYPKNDVEAVLDELTNKRTHPELPDIEDLTKLEREKILALCMYLLEKKHHFSGNGIWDRDTKEISHTIDPNTPLPEATLGKNIQFRYPLNR